MDCKDVREQLLGYQRGQLDGEQQAQIASHLEDCAGCRRAAAAEDDLSKLLEHKLPRHAAPLALKRRLAEQVSRPAAPATRARRLRRYSAPIVSALAAAALVLVAVRVTQPSFLRPSLATTDLVDEGLNDHLRVVASSHPVEIESGGIHQVNPWFTGRLDFAPHVSFSGDDRFKLEGGSIGYFRDRKAAVYVFKIRLHTISLFVFPADGLPWRTHQLSRVGPLSVDAHVSRGFNILLWREGELGYCLVSDVNRTDLDALAVRIATSGSPN